MSKQTPEQKFATSALAVAKMFFRKPFSRLFESGISFDKEFNDQDIYWHRTDSLNIMCSLSSVFSFSKTEQTEHLGGKTLLPVALQLKFNKRDVMAQLKGSITPADTNIPDFDNIGPFLFNMSSDGIKELCSNEQFENLPMMHNGSIVDFNVCKGKYENCDFKFYAEKDSGLIYCYMRDINDFLIVKKVRIADYSHALVVMDRNFIVAISDDNELPVNEEEMLDDEREGWSFSRHNAAGLTNKDFTDYNYISETIDDEIDTLKDLQSDKYVMSDDDLEEQPLNFRCGSEEMLGKELNMFFHALVPMHLWSRANITSFEVAIRSATDDGEGASLDLESMEWDGDYSSFIAGLKEDEQEEFKELMLDGIDHIMERNYPVGHTWEYNDGPYDRMSGYDKNAIQLRIPIEIPTAHEQICAQMDFKGMADSFSKTFIDKVNTFYNSIK